MKKSYLMAKRSFCLFSLLVFMLVCSLSGCKKNDSARQGEVVIYTYDSFCGEWGAGPEIARLFEEKTGIKVTYADCGDGVQILSKAILEKNAPYADILLGLDNNLIQKVRESDVLVNYTPSNSSLVANDLWTELNDSENKKDFILTPYDYSHFAMIWNSTSKTPAPKSLEDMTKPEYKNSIILMDARTSTVGLGFETWVKAIYGNKAEDYMNRLKPSVLTVSPSWSVGYGMFTEGEAPLVISYTTSPAYHVEYGEGDQFKALVFEEGHVRQIEGAGIVKGAPNKKGAEKFIEFLISNEAQTLLPIGQWMFPSNQNVELPESYKAAAPVPKTIK